MQASLVNPAGVVGPLRELLEENLPGTNGIRWMVNNHTLRGGGGGVGLWSEVRI